VEDMHKRKAEMAKQSNAFIALPGNIEFILINIRVIFNYQAEPASCSSLFIVPFTACLVMSHILWKHESKVVKHGRTMHAYEFDFDLPNWLCLVMVGADPYVHALLLYTVTL
jgi:hypothetical protein